MELDAQKEKIAAVPQQQKAAQTSVNGLAPGVGHAPQLTEQLSRHAREEGEIQPREARLELEGQQKPGHAAEHEARRAAQEHPEQDAVRLKQRQRRQKLKRQIEKLGNPSVDI